MTEFRRKAPRKSFDGVVGALFGGKLTVTRGSQLGEGGALIESNENLDHVQQGDKCVLSLFLPGIGGIVATAQCVYRSENDKIGLQFSDLDTVYKKKIREFVSRRKILTEVS